MKRQKRFAIYVCYDEHGTLDNSKTFFLENLVKVVDELLIVVNGEITPESYEIAKKYTPKILIRPDEGFDPWGYKAGMEHLGWDYLSQFDEMIHANDSCFGPIFPFEEMFQKMDESSADFWAITCHYEDKVKRIPFHLQTYFTIYRNKMIGHPQFRKIWLDLPKLWTHSEACDKHEVILTKKFVSLGFTPDLYIKTENLQWLSPRAVYDLPVELLKQRCPLIKKRLFSMDYAHCFNLGLGINASEALNYLTHHTKYDCNIIWDYLLSKFPQEVYRKNLHLTKVLPTRAKNKASLSAKKKIALIFHITYEDLIENSFQYVSAFPKYGHIYITTKPKSMKPKIEQKLNELGFAHSEVRLVEDRGRSESALLVACRDLFLDKGYDYICFAHDKKSKHLYNGTIPFSFSYKCLENVLKSETYIENIITEFETEPRLGLLTPPPPFHATYSFAMQSQKALLEKDYKNVSGLLRKLNINLSHSLKDIYVSTGSTFWCRPKALYKLFNHAWQYSDFPKEPVKNKNTLLHAIERIHTYVAQDAGFYSAWIMNDQYVPIEITNYIHLLEDSGLRDIPAREMVQALFGKAKRRLSRILFRL